MRLVSFHSSGATRMGVRVPEGVVDVAAICPDLPADMTAFLALGATALDAVRSKLDAGRPVAVAAADLLPPVPRPGKIICLGLNYAEHAKEGGMAIPQHPVVFLRVTTSLLAPAAPCRMSPLSTQLDYEAELAVVIGRAGRDILEADALAHVAGYSVFNDLTYRDYQFRGPQWTLGKNFDGTGPFGPDLVTADELPEGARGLAVRTRINGTTVQDGNTSDMIFVVADTIARLSQAMTLEPGDVIFTGTPAGVGAARKPPLWLQPGDVCEVEVEGVGTLTTPIVAADTAATALAAALA